MSCDVTVNINKLGKSPILIDKHFGVIIEAYSNLELDNVKFKI